MYLWLYSAVNNNKNTYDDRQTVRKLDSPDYHSPLLLDLRRLQSSMHPHRLPQPTKIHLKLGSDSPARSFQTACRGGTSET